MQLRLQLRSPPAPGHMQVRTQLALCRVAEGLRGLAEQTAERLARMQLRLQLETTTLHAISCTDSADSMILVQGCRGLERPGRADSGTAGAHAAAPAAEATLHAMSCKD